MKLRPLNDRIIVKPKEAATVSEGGVILPQIAGKEKPIEGVVIAAGPGKLAMDGTRIPLEVKAQDKIMFSKYAGTEIKIEDTQYLILRDEDVFAVMDE